MNDQDILPGQAAQVLAVMQDRVWRIPEEIMTVVPGTAASITARLRSFRQPPYSLVVESRRRSGTRLYEYRLLAVDTRLDSCGED